LIDVAGTGWDAVYKRHFPELYRAVYAVTLDADVTLDALHDAFERAVRAGPATHENVVGWLYRVAVRRARRLRLRTRLALVSESYKNELELAVDRMDVARLLRILTPRQREIVIAHYFLGLRQEEIAIMLKIRRGTVGATIAQALARMREEENHA
jgi:RNA polymerase sigma-70 factor (ECF subfamily)